MIEERLEKLELTKEDNFFILFSDFFSTMEQIRKTLEEADIRHIEEADIRHRKNILKNLFSAYKRFFLFLREEEEEALFNLIVKYDEDGSFCYNLIAYSLHSKEKINYLINKIIEKDKTGEKCYESALYGDVLSDEQRKKLEDAVIEKENFSAGNVLYWFAQYVPRADRDRLYNALKEKISSLKIGPLNSNKLRCAYAQLYYFVKNIYNSDKDKVLESQKIIIKKIEESGGISYRNIVHISMKILLGLTKLNGDVKLILNTILKWLKEEECRMILLEVYLFLRLFGNKIEEEEMEIVKRSIIEYIEHLRDTILEKKEHLYLLFSLPYFSEEEKGKILTIYTEKEMNEKKKQLFKKFIKSQI